LAVTRAATPGAVRRLGEAWLLWRLKAQGPYSAPALAGRIVSGCGREGLAPRVARRRGKSSLDGVDIACEVLRTMERLAVLEARVEGLLEADQCGPVLRSLRGMGTVLIAEFLAETIIRSGSALPTGSRLA